MATDYFCFLLDWLRLPLYHPVHPLSPTQSDLGLLPGLVAFAGMVLLLQVLLVERQSIPCFCDRETGLCSSGFKGLIKLAWCVIRLNANLPDQQLHFAGHFWLLRKQRLINRQGQIVISRLVDVSNLLPSSYDDFHRTCIPGFCWSVSFCGCLCNVCHLM